jgi:hypothetical protein
MTPFFCDPDWSFDVSDEVAFVGFFSADEDTGGVVVMSQAGGREEEGTGPGLEIVAGECKPDAYCSVRLLCIYLFLIIHSHAISILLSLPKLPLALIPN